MSTDIDLDDLPTGLVCPVCGSTDTWDEVETNDCEDYAGCNACGYEGTVYDLRAVDMIDDELLDMDDADLSDDEGTPFTYLAAVVGAMRAAR